MATYAVGIDITAIPRVRRVLERLDQPPYLIHWPMEREAQHNK